MNTNRNIEAITELQSKIVRLKRMEYEKILVQKFGTFSSKGLLEKQLRPIMDEYVNLHIKAFGTEPDWYHTDSIVYSSQKELDRLNLNTFRCVFNGDE